MTAENTDNPGGDESGPSEKIGATNSLSSQEPVTEVKVMAKAKAKPRKRAVNSKRDETAVTDKDLFDSGSENTTQFAAPESGSISVTPGTGIILSGKEAESNSLTSEIADAAVESANLASVNTQVKQTNKVDLPWYMLTNRSNLLSIIGAGAITVASDAWRYVTDSRQAFGGAIALWRGSVPSEISGYLEGRGVSSPVLLEFLPEVQAVFPSGNGDLRLSMTPVPFSKVRRIVFKDRETLEDFELKQFDDLPKLPDRILDHGFPEIGTGNLSRSEMAPVSAFSFSSFDRQMGALIASTDAMNGRMNARHLYCSLLNNLLLRFHQSAASLETRSSAVSKSLTFLPISESSSDRWLFEVSLSILDSVDLEEGFNGTTFLNSIETAASVAVNSNQGFTAEDRAEISEWCSHCRQLLDGTREVWALTDTHHNYVKRGVLLFILRPEQERFRKVMASSIKPGPRVYMLAAFLLGYMTGVTRIESTIKKSGQPFFALVGHFLSVDGLSSAPDQGIKVELKILSEDQACLEATHGDFLIGKWEVPISPAIRKTCHLMRQAGMNLTIDFFSNRVSFVDKQRKSLIQIDEISRSLEGERIRIWAEVKSMTGSKPNDLGEIYRSMLEFNGLESSHGNFMTISEESKTVYAVDFAVSLLTSPQVKFLLQHVSDVTSTFSVTK